MSYKMVSAILRGGENGSAIPIAPHPTHKVSIDKMRLVLISYAEHANPDRISWPGTKTVARETGIGTTTVGLCRDELVRQNLLELVSAGKGGFGVTNRYFVLPNHDGKARKFESAETIPSDQSETIGQQLPSDQSETIDQPTTLRVPPTTLRLVGDEPVNPHNRQNGYGGVTADAAGASAPSPAVIDNFVNRIAERLGQRITPTTKLVAAISAKAAWDAAELADAATHRKFNLDEIADVSAFLAARIRLLPADPSAVAAKKPTAADRAEARKLADATIRDGLWQMLNCEHKHDCDGYRTGTADAGVNRLLDECDSTFFDEFDPDESSTWPHLPRITDVERCRIAEILAPANEKCEQLNEERWTAALRKEIQTAGTSADNAVNDPSDAANGHEASATWDSSIWA